MRELSFTITDADRGYAEYRTGGEPYTHLRVVPATGYAAKWRSEFTSFDAVDFTPPDRWQDLMREVQSIALEAQRRIAEVDRDSPGPEEADGDCR